MAEFCGLLDEHAEGLRKPLYLQGQSEMAVELDGRSLRVLQVERAALLYPLMRLARVLSKGEVRWSCEALLACAAASVPVVFLDREGNVRGYLFGPASGGDMLYPCLRAGIRRSGGWGRYADWRRTMRSHAQWTLEQQLRRANVIQDQVLVWMGWRPVGQGAVNGILDAPVVRCLHGVLTGLSAQLLMEAGLSAERLDILEPLPLVDDLAELLEWVLAESLLTAVHYEREPECMRDERALVALVESRRNELFQFGRLLLGYLQHWMDH